ncbi:hypothetical protein BpHYR1_003606 [Brachionus plicatilis]|uniref:Uncharacterized protein n=1 Tax=Brachionus plicatilis TaxID=10195 RepID=A0A3M7PFU4_BRAPC|nr:hypothetical protein BpHYR1_003606 [Brachionus plicatilis]
MKKSVSSIRSFTLSLRTPFKVSPPEKIGVSLSKTIEKYFILNYLALVDAFPHMRKLKSKIFAN